MIQFVAAYIFYYLLILAAVFGIRLGYRKLKNIKYVRKDFVSMIVRNEILILLGILIISSLFKLIFRNNLQFNVRNIYYMAFMFIIATLCNLLYCYRKEIVNKIETLTFLFIVLIGTLFIAIYPNNIISWDEEIHYNNVLSLSHMGNANLNKADEDLIINYTDAVAGDGTIYYSIAERNKKNQLLDDEGKETSVMEVSMKYKSGYNYVAYIPAAIVLTIFRILHMPFVLTFMAGRMAILLTYAFAIYLAMRKIKKGKLLIATIALLPTCMIQATTYSYDYWVICFTIYANAWLFGELQQPKKKIKLKEIVAMIGVFVIALGPKAIYFPIMLWMLFLKKEKFETEKQYRWSRRILIGSVIFVVLSFVLPFVLGGVSSGTQDVGDMRGGIGVNSMEQIKFILTNPIRYAGILLKFLSSYLLLDNANGYITFWSYLGKSSDAVLGIVIIVCVILLEGSCKPEYSLLEKKEKAGVYIITFITICMAVSVIYISFTPVGLETINGCQPRYILPVLFPVCYALSNNKVKWEGNKNVFYGVTLGMMSFILLSGYWQVLLGKLY